MLLFDQLTQLDLTGPHEVLARLPGATVHLVARTREPVRSETGLAILPTATFADVPRADLLFVPGGWGQVAAGDHAETLAWLRAVGATASWVTSACTGALLLGIAGLLEGYRATTHWAFHDLLSLVGATPVHERVVLDRNRITGGGVTAGIDAALIIAERTCGRAVAEAIQLQLEYDPQPPFTAGHPRTADPALVAQARERVAARYEARKRQLTGSD
ncbi:MAG: DJ-1/PfpI family protein [Deltaproteobacteria bacterium]|nr:DJ-1/PfpI family protein [Deltaproteobacteria bacterium]